MNAKRRAASLLLAMMLAACANTPGPTVTSTGTASPGPSLITVATPDPSVAPSPTVAAATPTPQLMPTSEPTPSPAPTLGEVTAASLPVRSSVAYAGFLLAPGGRPYAIVTDSGPTTTVVAALGSEGRPAPGWPVAIPGAEGVVPTFGPDGTLYLLVEDSDQATALTALGRDGKVAAGWPVSLGDSGCSDPPLLLADGTIRVACYVSEDANRVYAFDRQGWALPGWPVDVPGPDVTWPAWVALGTTLVGLEAGPGWVRRLTIAADGTIRRGTRVTVPAPNGSCYGDAASYVIGPDGTAYERSQKMQAPGGRNGCRVLSSTFSAFDERGVRPGWPVTVSGETSAPVPGPGGRIYVTQGTTWLRPTRIFAFDAGGRRVAGWPVMFDIAPVIGQYGAGWSTAPVRLGEDGTVYLITEDRGTTIYVLSPDGRVLPGWPYRSTSRLGDGFAQLCDCTGGGHPVITPVIDAAGRLHLVQEGSAWWRYENLPGPVTLVAGGRTSQGWPVTLARTGSRYVALEVDAAGITYALAGEYEGPARSGTPIWSIPKSETLLAIAPDGTVIFRTTLVEP
jgi:hypothetical protein